MFLVGSLIRYDCDQYTWKSDSSQLCAAASCAGGQSLPLGILGIFGHLFGLLTPLAVWHALGVTAAQKQTFAMVAGGIAGLAARAGWCPHPPPPEHSARAC